MTKQKNLQGTPDLSHSQSVGIATDLLKSITLVFAFLFITLLLVSRGFGEPNPDPCEPSGCAVSSIHTYCKAGEVTFTNLSLSPTNSCLWTPIGASISQIISNGYVIFTTSCTNSCGEACTNSCPSPATNAVIPNVLSNVWVATVGTWSTNGTDFSAGFTPTNCGEGTIKFTSFWINGCDTNIQETIASTNFIVANVDIVETNKVICVCDNAELTLTNTCGEVTWEVTPADSPGGPTVSEGMVTAGTNCGVWTVTARSAENTNCADSAEVTVVRVASMTGMSGTLVSTNPPTYIVCPVPTNSLNPYMEICATACPAILETNLPACWQMTGGLSKTNANGSISRICRRVDLRQMGTTTITASAGCSSNTVVIIVQDTNPPVMTVPANITAYTRTLTCDRRVSFSATATDDCPEPINVTCNPPSGTLFSKGITTVTCTATDAAGNTATTNFTVTVVDNVPPTITCSTNITVCGSASGATVTYGGPIIDDNCGLTGVTWACVPPSGSNFPAGTTTVTCTATDSSGNTTNCSFTVTVVEIQLITPAGDPVTAPDDSGDGQNEFTFSTANSGVLTVPIKITTNPDSATVRSWLQGKIRVGISSIGDSHSPSGPYITTFAWNNPVSGDFTTGIATYSGSAWTATATYTGLPLNNSDFGTKSVTVTVQGCQSWSGTWEAFYPATTTNHPGGNATDPNWFYYYKQNAGGGAYTYTNSGRSLSLSAQGDATIKIGDEAYAGDQYITTQVVAGQLTATGVSGTTRFYANFLGVLAHERQHANNQTNAGPPTDADSDRLSNTFEAGTSFTNPNDPESARGVLPSGSGWTDREVYAGGPIEQQAIASANTSNDWSKPGTNSKP